jgi:hypothetical protein
MVNLADYFKYHPPISEERKLAHETVNRLCLVACENLFASQLPDIVEKVCTGLASALLNLTRDAVCGRWITNAIDRLKESALSGDEEAILMLIQQARMFANQGITLDELRLEDVYADDSAEEHF